MQPISFRSNAPFQPSPFEEMRTASAKVAEAIASGEWTEAIARAERLYTEAATLGAKAFQKDYEESTWAVALDLIEALASPKLERNLSVKHVLATTVRLYLDIMLWQTLVQPPPQRRGLRDRLFGLKTKKGGVLQEETASTVRSKLSSVMEACPDTEVSLRFHLRAALEVFKLLPTEHDELKSEYTGFIFSTLMSFSAEGADLGKISEGIDLIRKLHELKIKGWIAEVLYLQWARVIACRHPAPLFDDLQAIIRQNREKEEIALCAIELYADFTWSAPSPYKGRALDELVTFASDHAHILHRSRWEVRHLALTHLKALSAQHPDEEIRKKAHLSIDNARQRDKHSKIVELLASADPEWNSTLHDVRPMAGPSLEQDRKAKEEAFFQAFLIKHKIADPQLSALFDEDPDRQDLDLSLITGGISPEGFQAAMRKATKLQTLSLKGHPHLTIAHLLAVKPPALIALDLTGHPITDTQLQTLLMAYPALQSLTLNGCEQLTGAHLELFKGDTLNLKGTKKAVGPSGLKRALAHIQSLDLSESAMPLEVLQHAQTLSTLRLCGRALKPQMFARCPQLTTLDLERAHGNLSGALASLPSTLKTLTLSSCEGINDIALNSIIQLSPHLEALYLEETEITGWEISKDLLELRTLHLSFALNKTPVSPESLQRNPLNLANLAEHCPLLENLSVEGRFFTPEDLTEIVRKAPNLRKLKARACPHAQENLLKALIQCPIEEIDLEDSLEGIESLDVSDTSFSDPDLFLLSHCSRLTKLNLSRTPLTDLGTLLRTCPSLETLQLEGCGHILSEGLLDLAALPHLTDALLEQILDAFPDVTHLDLSGATNLTPQQLIKTVVQNRTITTLNLSNKKMTVALIKALENMTSLETLFLQGCTQVLASDLATFAKLPQLKRLDLNGIDKISSSTKIDLSGAPFLSNGMLLNFLEYLPKLQRLILRGCSELTNEGLEGLMHCPELEFLDLTGCSGMAFPGAFEILSASPSLKTVITDQGNYHAPFNPTPVETLPQQETPPEPLVSPEPATQWPAQEIEGPLPALKGMYKHFVDKHYLPADEQALQSPLPLLSKEVGRAPLSLEKALDAFLQTERPCFVLSGEEGSGKSLFLKSLERKRWHDPLKLDYHPLLIDLKGTCQEDLIAVELGKMGYDSIQIDILRKDYKFLFLLDHYDEMRVQIPVQKLTGDWKCKVVLTCRTQSLARFPDSWDDEVPLDPRYKHVHTALPLSENQIEEYFARFIPSHSPWTKEDYLNAIRKRESLRDLPYTPLLLRLGLDALPSLTHLEVVKRFDIYQAFVSSWFQKARDRLHGRLDSPPTLKEFYTFAGKLAFPLIQSGSVHAHDESERWQTFFTQDAENAPELSPLLYQGEGRYLFFHQSFAAFFFANFLLSALHMKGEEDTFNQTLNTRQILETLESHPLNQKRRLQGEEGKEKEAYLCAEPGLMQFLAEQITLHPRWQARLLQIVLASKNNPSVATAASNAFTLLNLSGYSFGGCDLSSIQAPYAHLENALLVNANLEGANLQGAFLKDARMIEANFANVNLQGASFGKLPAVTSGYCFASALNRNQIAIGQGEGTIEIWDSVLMQRVLKVKGHRDNVALLDYSQDGTQILSLYEDGNLEKIEVATGKIMRSFQPKGTEVTSMAISPDGEEIAVATHGVEVVNKKIDFYDYLQKPIRYWRGGAPRGRGSGGRGRGRGSTGTVRGSSGRGRAHGPRSESSPQSIFPPPTKTSPSKSAERTEVLIQRFNALGELFNVLNGHRDRVNSLAYSKDGTKLLSGSSDGTIRQWKLSEGKQIGPPIQACFKEARVTSVAYSPNNSQILSGSSDYMISRWNASNGKLIGKALKHLRAEPASRFVDAGRSHEKYYRLPCVAYSPNGKEFLSGGEGILCRWDAKTGMLLGTPLYPSSLTDGIPLRRATYSPDGKRIFLHTGAVLSLNLAQDHTLIQTSISPFFSHHTEPVKVLAVSPDKSEIASGSFEFESVPEMQMDLLDFQNWLIEKYEAPPLSEDEAVEWTLKRIAPGLVHSSLRRWEIDTGIPLGSPLLDQIDGECVTYSPDGSQIAATIHPRAAVKDQRLLMSCWDAKTGALIGTPEFNQQNKTFDEITFFSPSGISYTSNGQDIVGMYLQPLLSFYWNVASGKVKKWVQDEYELKGLNQIIPHMAFSPDGERCAAGFGTSHRLCQWKLLSHDMQFFRIDKEDEYTAAVAYSPDGKQLASAGQDHNYELSLWDPLTSPPTLLKRNTIGHAREILSLAYSPDGTQIASGSGDKTARIWDFAQEKSIACLTLHSEQVTCVAWPKMDMLITGSRDRTIALWKPLPTHHGESRWCPIWQTQGKYRLNAWNANFQGARFDPGYFRFPQETKGTIEETPLSKEEEPFP